MRRVPPGFNALVTARAAESIAAIRRYVTPIFRVDPGGSPVFEGSGVFARIAGVPLLVSAAHVFDQLRSGVHLLLDAREREPLSRPARVTLKTRPGPRIFDAIDLGFVELTPAEAAAARPENFADITAPESSAPTRWYTRYLLLGYPYKRQKRLDADSVYRLEQTYYTAPELGSKQYENVELDHARHIAVEFNHRRIAGPTGRGGKPNFHGMSGGGIWILDPYSPGSSPQLAGFLVGQTPRNQKTLFGHTTGMLLQLFSSYQEARVADPAPAG